jgi:hypothetical protein
LCERRVKNDRFLLTLLVKLLRHLIDLGRVIPIQELLSLQARLDVLKRNVICPYSLPLQSETDHHIHMRISLGVRISHTQRFLGARIRTVAGVTVFLDRELRRLEPSDLFESGKVRLDGFSEFSEGRKVSFVLDCHVELSDLLKDCLFESVKDLLTCEAHFFFC